MKTYSVKYEGFSIKTIIKQYPTKEDAEDDIRATLYYKTKDFPEICDFYENERVSECFDPDGNEWTCCTRLWI